MLKNLIWGTMAALSVSVATLAAAQTAYNPQIPAEAALSASASASGSKIVSNQTKYQPVDRDAAILEALTRMEQRIDSLEAQNAQLRAELAQQNAAPPTMSYDAASYNGVAAVPGGVVATQANYANANVGNVSASYVERDAAYIPAARDNNANRKLVATNGRYGYEMLDHAERVNEKPLVQLEYLATGALDATVTLSGGAVAIMDSQRSNRDSKFGYLMRHPTSRNQIGKKSSEAVLHSATLAVTAPVTEDFTTYAELLYNPEQSFGAGTITDLNRNQIQLRRGWIMYGNLNKSPVYALIGKMDVPFGLNDSLSPFTNSSNWHAFYSLAYGAQLGLKTGGFSGRIMAVQGGAQFRGANAQVDESNTPSRLNNFAADARYRFDFNNRGDGVMFGASYLHGSAYCSSYPVVHFSACKERNPAWSAYGKLNYGPLELLGEYASTTKVWPGTQVPDPNNPLSKYKAHKAQSFTIGSRLGLGKENGSSTGHEFALSGEFSKFIAGDKGAPWERQNQFVLGGSWFPADNVNVFGEFTHVDGYVPLNFLSGGNFPDGSTWSDRDANTDVILLGVQVAF